MCKTTSLHYSSSTFLLLLLLVLTATANSSKQQDEQEEEEEGLDINLTMVDIHNDLPPNSPRLSVVGSFQSTEAEIEPGKSYSFVAGGNPETGTLFMENDSKCAKILVFDPKAELGRHAVFWSVRIDGAYHSWDRSNWQKRASWKPGNQC